MTPTIGVPEVLARSRKAIHPATVSAIDRLAPEIRQIAAYHLGWTDASGNPIEAPGGKGIRPTLAILGAEAAWAAPSVGVPGGVAVELVHNFSLIHDDIIDTDTERHHRPTVWSVFGVGQAIVAGDALQILAHQVLLESSPADRTGRASRPRRRHRPHDRRASRRHRLRETPGCIGRAVHRHVGRQDRRPARRRRVDRGHILAGAPDATVGALRRLRTPPGPGLPGGRRSPGHLGRPRDHRQAGRERPPNAQEVHAGGVGSGRRRERGRRVEGAYPRSAARRCCQLPSQRRPWSGSPPSTPTRWPERPIWWRPAGVANGRPCGPRPIWTPPSGPSNG